METLALAQPIPLTNHPAEVYLRSLAAGSRPTMSQSLDAIARLLTDNECDRLSLDWAALRYRHTSSIQSALGDLYSPTTVQKMMCALRRVLLEARRLGLMSAEDYQQAVELPTIRAVRSLRGRALSQVEIHALMHACKQDKSLQGLRDAAMVAILRGGGLRRGEVVKLELEDLDVKTGELKVRQGKGDKDRLVYLPDGALPFVKKWLKKRGDAPGAILCPIRKGGEIQLRSMSAQSVLLILQKRAEEAGIKAFSPHDFRRTFCSDLLDAGVDIVTVQKLAGHASPVTTAKYDRRGEETKRKAVQKLGF